jgi:RNA polymerase sigma factor (sigma-70 family)
VASSDCPPPDPAALLPHTVEGGLLIVAVRTLGDVEEARDAVQETLTRALAAIRGDRVPPGVPLEAFVYGIARHVIADVQRRRVRERAATGDSGELPAPGPSALDVLVRAEERDAMSHALASLPAVDRELLECCFVQGERVAAIAARTGEPADRIRKRKSRALERMREVLSRSAGSHEMPQGPILPT